MRVPQVQVRRLAVHQVEEAVHGHDPVRQREGGVVAGVEQRSVEKLLDRQHLSLGQAQPAGFRSRRGAGHRHLGVEAGEIHCHDRGHQLGEAGRRPAQVRVFCPQHTAGVEVE